MRYELPPGLSGEEERAIASALDEYFGTGVVRPDPWALAGRAEALRVGALQVRHQATRPWGGTWPSTFARRGTEPRSGRGDSR